jgi:hypothetical protein
VTRADWELIKALTCGAGQRRIDVPVQSGPGIWWKRCAKLPTAWFGARKVTVISFEPHVRHFRRFTIFTTG